MRFLLSFLTSPKVNFGLRCCSPLMPLVEEELGQPVIPAEEIEHQLAKLLESHHFCHSHRYPALLKFLVEQTMNGKGTVLKERLVGIEVFHRAPDYDTNTDPVVRVTAAEVRKRIAQYYQEPEHSAELRIDLPTGSYVPRFHRLPTPVAAHPANGASESAVAVTEPHTTDDSLALPDPAQTAAVVSDSRRWPWLRSIAAVCIGILLSLAFLLAQRTFRAQSERAVRDFWAPNTVPDIPTVLVIGDHSIGAQGNALRASQGAAVNPAEEVLKLMNEHEQVTLSDVTSLFKIIDYMVRHREPYKAIGAGSASIDDLRHGPVLLFAGLDNRWTMRLSEHLRYRFVDSPNDAVGIIEDAQNPGRRWTVDFAVPYSKMPMDYAIVARYYDPLIEQPVIIAAGVGETGTVSASEFVTSEHLIEDLDQLAPQGWKHSNVEVVLATPVIDGHPGPPHIVASNFW